MTDTTAQDFQVHRERLAQATAAEELLSRVKARQQPKPEGAAVVPATDPTQDVVSDMSLSELVTGKRQQSLPVRVAKDIGVGIVETPRGILKGVRDAYQNTIDIGKELGDWVEQKAHLPVLMVDGEGLRFVSNEQAKGQRLSDYATLPDINPPKTVTGGLVKGVTQFLVGMKGAGKLMDVAGIPKAAGAAGYGLSALKGAIANFAAFDPHQQRLSNLIQQFPALQNPVTEYLASDPNDNAAEGRFKNSLEGFGMGVITDGFFAGVKFLRNVAIAKRAINAQEAAAAAASDAAGAQVDDALSRIGNVDAPPESPLVQPEAASAPKNSTAGVPEGGIGPAPEPTPGKVFINFARIDTPEDVQKAMQEMADLHAGSIDAARRGVQTFEQIELSADQINAWEALQQRRPGAPLNAEQSVAARQLWASSADTLKTAAQTAADAPNEANLFAFRKMLATHYAIQKEVIAARTETARSLASWRIPVGSSAERLRDLTAALEAQGGGTQVTRELAKRVAALSEAGMANELESVVERTVYARTRDAVMEGWINGLLSNPTTHVANTVSNASVIGVRMTERAIAAKIAGVLGDEGSVAAGEAAAQWFGVTQGWKDAFRYAWKAAKTGESGFGIGKLETAREGSITSEAFNLSSDTMLGRGVDMLGSVVRTPGRALTAEDEFFKTIGYRMEVNAQALRQATAEVNAGQLAEDGLKQRIAELVANPPENIRLAAVDAALYQTFTNAPGELARHLGQLTTHYPMLKVIIPFVRTPANILRFTFERTPIAPLMSQFRANIAAGGARRDLALAQVALGTGIMMTTADLAMNGQITGSGPLEKGTRDAMAREGWQPYSIKIGNRWYSYNRLDPVGSLLGMSADVVDALRNAQHESLDDTDTEKLAVATSIAIAGNVVNKTYLSGLSSIFEAMSAPQQYGEATIQRMVGSVVPAGVAGANRLVDPYQRQVYSMLDAIKARTPGLSEKLMPRRNLWGEPLKYESGIGKAFDALSPVYSKQPANEPIDKELLRLESNLTMPSRKTSFDGVTIDLGQYPKIYSRYLELAGNELKHPAWNMGAKDMLNAVVKGEHPLSAVYRLRTDGPDGGKDVFIRDTVRQYREMARRQLLKEFPDLASEVREKQARQRALKMPVQAG